MKPPKLTPIETQIVNRVRGVLGVELVRVPDQRWLAVTLAVAVELALQAQRLADDEEAEQAEIIRLCDVYQVEEGKRDTEPPPPPAPDSGTNPMNKFGYGRGDDE